MPPFVLTKCPNCSHSNRFDLAEMKDINTTAFKLFDLRSLISNDEEFIETCKKCGHKFKFTVKGAKDGKEK